MTKKPNSQNFVSAYKNAVTFARNTFERVKMRQIHIEPITKTSYFG